MKLVYLKIGLLAFVLSTAIACGKNKKDDGVNVSGNGNSVADRVVGPSNLPTGQGNMAGSQSAAVVGTGQTQAQFDETIKVFLSVAHDPSQVGSVDLQQGVQIAGRIAVNSSNGSAMGNSVLRLTISDSYTRQGQAEPFQVTLNTVTGGASNGKVNLLFSDEYGSVTITGTYTAQQITAKVDFTNTKGPHSGKSGTLGNFVIPTCAFFVCQ